MVTFSSYHVVVLVRGSYVVSGLDSKSPPVRSLCVSFRSVSSCIYIRGCCVSFVSKVVTLEKTRNKEKNLERVIRTLGDKK
jgi:hypothetical protein